MSQTFRLDDLMQMAREEGRIVAEDAARRMGVTVQTIRRDLLKLSESGKLTRVHGGAVLASGTTNIGYADRRELNTDEKAAIAAACVAEIPDNAAIFMNIGTTTEAVARALIGHRGILVVTNNINVANTLVANPDCEIVVAGGQLRRTDGGLVGTLANSIVEQFKFDLAIIGCSAMDADGDLLDFDMMEVGVSQTAIRRARKTFLVADHTKFARSAPARIASLADIDAFFTDRPLDAELTSRCKAWNTRVVVAG
ncbi:DeoR/GlpR family DNA-binding transcription regulator [Martelella radicis]|uniref:DeoR family glycerol-3-phosphate regulon repressor n=1 Tax=Martelella radicis TaxID=1397476 RepID=A0A7W6KMZ7_9HYPH|nr:DeoR/GlpR family DNA-binding transcription regulator [Martelella radicis]MBB4123049.1 DeoR family glycerol-3-phosphate regulon repressor [Martelella radicis]